MLDPAPLIDFSGHGLWNFNDLGFGLFNSGGGIADSDGDGIPNVAFPPTSNFKAGVNYRNCSCGPESDPKKRLTQEQDLWASHGVLPAELTGPDDDGDGIHNSADNCEAVFNPLQEDVNFDCTGDACEVFVEIPAMDSRGLLLLSLGLVMLGAFASWQRLTRIGQQSERDESTAPLSLLGWSDSRLQVGRSPSQTEVPVRIGITGRFGVCRDGPGGLLR